jgi:NADPH2:quinone reductase
VVVDVGAGIDCSRGRAPAVGPSHRRSGGPDWPGTVKAAWYERQGPATDVLVVGEMETPEPGPGEVRIRVAASGINPGDVKKRQDAFRVGMPFPRVIPHSDGAGVIDAVGHDVPSSRLDERVWCYGAQSYRPFGTAAEYVVVPARQAVVLHPDVPFAQGACLGIAGMTAHRAVSMGGSAEGRVVLVQGGAGAVGQCAVALARAGGATVIATVRSDRDAETAKSAGAHYVVDVKGVSVDEAAQRILVRAPEGVDHIVEVSFGSNIGIDERVLGLGGSIATYATADPTPTIPFWPLLFKNAHVHFVGSDDFPPEARSAAALALNSALQGGWEGFEIGVQLPLESIADAHVLVEEGRTAGRVVLTVEG